MRPINKSDELFEGGKCKSGTTNEAHKIQNKQVEPKTTTRVDFQNGFLWGGSDGVDHDAIEVLQHDVANRRSPGSPPEGVS